MKDMDVDHSNFFLPPPVPKKEESLSLQTTQGFGRTFLNHPDKPVTFFHLRLLGRLRPLLTVQDSVAVTEKATLCSQKVKAQPRSDQDETSST